MKRTHTLVQRHKGRGIKTWYIRTCINGKENFKSTGTTNKTEAMKIFAKVVSSANNQSTNLSDIIINDEADAWLKSKERCARNADRWRRINERCYEAYRKAKKDLRAKERIDFWNEKPKLEPNKGYAINGCKGMKKFSSRKTLQPIEWRNIYMWVERKCLEKAKEYK